MNDSGKKVGKKQLTKFQLSVDAEKLEIELLKSFVKLYGGKGLVSIFNDVIYSSALYDVKTRIANDALIRVSNKGQDAELEGKLREELDISRPYRSYHIIYNYVHGDIRLVKYGYSIELDSEQELNITNDIIQLINLRQYISKAMDIEIKKEIESKIELQELREFKKKIEESKNIVDK